MEEYTIAKYLRLSSEDKDLKDSIKNESNSIANQRRLIDNYISSHREFDGASVIEFCDVGWSGFNFDRPAMQHLMEMLASGEIQCIIVTDISRFGRKHLFSGNYLSYVFPHLGARFIAINNGLDTAQPEGVYRIDNSFISLLKYCWSHDISLKDKSSLAVRAKQGFLSSYAPYGYREDPDNKDHLLIDSEPAKIVHRIFRMIGQGTAVVCVTEQLHNEGIPAPSFYKGDLINQVDKANFWKKETIYKIVRDEQYLGKTVYERQVFDQVECKHTVETDRTNWIAIEDHHEPIVTQEEFDLAQNALRAFDNCKAHPSSNPLSLRVRCGVCGRVMNRVENMSAYYYCESQRSTEQYYYPHEYVDETDLIEMILPEIHKQATIAIESSLALEARRAHLSDHGSDVLKEIISLRETKKRKRLQVEALCEAYI